MPARRCSTCSLDLPLDDFDALAKCPLCEGGLSYFQNIEGNPDWREEVAQARWREPAATSPMYGGATVMTRFERYLDSLVGADDFVLECGEWAPKGIDWSEWGDGD